MPPSCAIVIASRASVTVSMAADSDRQVESDVARQLRCQVDLARQDFRIGRNEQDVVEGECFFEDSHMERPGFV